ncbi:MAG TPA: hypothetical protein VLY04_16335 [Bryobacteraceae bacterium]|nr:hypothetical protein [Bryobacteraceae bacterium]
MPAEKGAKVRLDEFTARAVPDPKNPDALLVTGFLGAASEPNKTRIYWDASLTSYVDVDSGDILHSEPLPAAQSSLGGSYVWLRRHAEATFGSASGQTSKGKFFEGPLTAAYGGQFGAAAGAGAAGAGAALPITQNVICRPTELCTLVAFCRQSVYSPCASHLVLCVTPACPILSAAVVCVASPGCPPVGPGTPVQGGGGPVEGAAAAAAMPQALPSLVCSYAAGCWYSYGACPTQGACGLPIHQPVRYHAEAAAAAPQIAGSYAPHCWYSWNACPTMFGVCGPHHTPACPQVQAQAAAAPQAIAGSYAPHCWYSWNACPTMYGCGPHRTPACPQAEPAAAQPQYNIGIFSRNAYCTYYCGSIGGVCTHGVVCGGVGTGYLCWV